MGKTFRCFVAVTKFFSDKANFTISSLISSGRNSNKDILKELNLFSVGSSFFFASNSNLFFNSSIKLLLIKFLIL